MKKEKSEDSEQASAPIGFLALAIALLLLAGSYAYFPATANIIDHAPWLLWQIDKDTMPILSYARVGLLIVAMGIFAIIALIATFAFGPLGEAWRCRILWLSFAALSVPMGLHMLVAWFASDTHGGAILGTFEPDSWMRLSQVRDWLVGGSWYDHFVHRDNAPFDPTTNHWTRALDLIIALIVKLQGSTEMNVALIRAGVVLPWIWTSLLVLALLKLAGRFGDAVLTPLLVVAFIVCDQVFWGYFMIGNADHHALLGALFAWIILLLTGAPSTHDARIAGLLLALMVWLSPEAVVLAGGLYFYYGLRWLRTPEDSNPLAELATVAAFGVSAALLIERPPAEWLVPAYDSLSIVHALLFLLCAGVTQWLIALPVDRPLPWRLARALGGSAVVLVVLGSVYPHFFGGPMVETSQFIKQNLMPTLFETQPLWIRPHWLLVAVLWRPLLAVALGVLLWRRDKSIELPLYMLCVTHLLFVLQFRWCYYSYPLAVVVLAAGLGRLLAQQGDGKTKLLASIAVLAALEVPLALFNGQQVFTPWSQRALASTHQAHEWMFRGKFNDIGNGHPLIVAAPTTLGSHLLFWTPHHIIAANYHRDAEGIEYLWNLDAPASTTELRDYLAKRHVGALLLCFGTTPDGLLDRLRQGTQQPPEWLERVPLDTYLPPDSAPALFLVRP